VDDEAPVCPACNKPCGLYEGKARGKQPAARYMATTCCDAIFAFMPFDFGEIDVDDEGGSDPDADREGRY
jgi:hypothetical protein